VSGFQVGTQVQSPWQCNLEISKSHDVPQEHQVTQQPPKGTCFWPFSTLWPNPQHLSRNRHSQQGKSQRHGHYYVWFAQWCHWQWCWVSWFQWEERKRENRRFQELGTSLVWFSLLTKDHWRGCFVLQCGKWWRWRMTYIEVLASGSLFLLLFHPTVRYMVSDPTVPNASSWIIKLLLNYFILSL